MISLVPSEISLATSAAKIISSSKNADVVEKFLSTAFESVDVQLIAKMEFMLASTEFQPDFAAVLVASSDSISNYEAIVDKVLALASKYRYKQQELVSVVINWLNALHSDNLSRLLDGIAKSAHTWVLGGSLSKALPFLERVKDSSYRYIHSHLLKALKNILSSCLSYAHKGEILPFDVLWNDLQKWDEANEGALEDSDFEFFKMVQELTANLVSDSVGEAAVSCVVSDYH
jgi:hypothetical protein